MLIDTPYTFLQTGCASMDRANTQQETLLQRLKNSTILSSWTPRQHIPVPVINLMRWLAEQGDDALSATSNHFEAARERMNRRWAGPSNDPTAPQTATSQFKTLRGVLASYWTSEKWAEAWAGTAAIATIHTLNAYNIVGLTEAGAQFINTVATIVASNTQDTAAHQTLLKNAGHLGSAVTLQILYGWMSARVELDMQRKMSGWISNQFNQSVFAHSEIIQRITHNRAENSTDPDAMPDNPHNRVFYASRQVSRNLVGLGSGAFSTVMTSAFIGYALCQKSVPITMLDDLGRAINDKIPGGIVDLVPGQGGTALLAGLVATGYVSATLRKALSLGQEMRDNDTKMQKADGALYETLIDTFNRGDAIAASKGHIAQKKSIESGYIPVDQTWSDDVKQFSRYSTFMSFQQAAGHHLIATIPGLAGAVSKNLSFEGFLASHGLVSAFINQLYYVFNAIPQHANLMSAAERLQGLAIMVDKVQNKKEFYRLSGTHDFESITIKSTPDAPLLRMDNIQLMQRGKSTPFMSLNSLTVQPGDWIYVNGPSGVGKTSVLKASCGQWPYGSGTTEIVENANIFYAKQDADISGNRSLSEHILYGTTDRVFIPSNIDHDLKAAFASPDTQQARIAWALKTAGLGEFIEHANDKTNAGRPWHDTLSGGQKRRLILARLLYQAPDIILLDEAESGLHPTARIEFLTTIKEHCPKAGVMAIIHGNEMLLQKDGTPFFNKILTVEDKVATLTTAAGRPARIASDPKPTTHAGHHQPVIH